MIQWCKHADKVLQLSGIYPCSASESVSKVISRLFTQKSSKAVHTHPHTPQSQTNFHVFCNLLKCQWFQEGLKRVQWMSKHSNNVVTSALMFCLLATAGCVSQLAAATAERGRAHLHTHTHTHTHVTSWTAEGQDVTVINVLCSAATHLHRSAVRLRLQVCTVGLFVIIMDESWAP